MASGHWIDYGFNENRDVAVPNWDEIWYGGFTNEFMD
jgi:hypothetical protein